MRNYEITYIADPDIDESAFKQLNDQVATLIKDGGGKVTKTDIWGKRNLAYAIRKKTEGQYVVLQVEMDAEAVTEFERQLRLREPVMRYLIVAAEEEPGS